MLFIQGCMSTSKLVAWLIEQNAKNVIRPAMTVDQRRTLPFAFRWVRGRIDTLERGNVAHITAKQYETFETIEPSTKTQTYP